MRMLNNVKVSRASNSKHAEIKYFWRKDCVINGNTNIKCYPVDKMVSNHMSKPLQGRIFKAFRNAITGQTHVLSLCAPTSSSKESVDNNCVKENKYNLKTEKIGRMCLRMTCTLIEKCGKCEQNEGDENEGIQHLKGRSLAIESLHSKSKVQATK